jgi:hypothetical protein
VPAGGYTLEHIKRGAAFVAAPGASYTLEPVDGRPDGGCQADAEDEVPEPSEPSLVIVASPAAAHGSHMPDMFHGALKTPRVADAPVAPEAFRVPVRAAAGRPGADCVRAVWRVCLGAGADALRAAQAARLPSGADRPQHGRAPRPPAPHPGAPCAAPALPADGAPVAHHRCPS